MQFSSAWNFVSNDSFIFEIANLVASIDFIDSPHQFNSNNLSLMSCEMQRACDDEVSQLLAKNAIIPIFNSSRGFCSSIFLVPKKMGGFWPIINLKNLNSFVHYVHFKMEGMESVKQLICKDDWMVKQNLKYAYLAVPIQYTCRPQTR